MRSIFLTLILFHLVGCSSSNYYLVRHAEKVDESRDPLLSEAGLNRANALKDSLLAENLDLLYATPYQRTQMTLEPLASALGKEVITYDAGKTFEFVESLKKLNNKNVVVAGHSNTVPDMVLYFTGDTVHIGHDEYSHLFLVKKKKGIFKAVYELEEKKYGGD